MMTVEWSPRADETYGEILEYLSEQWGLQVAIRFMDEVEHTIELIRQFPRMFEASPSHPTIRKGFITKHTTLFYEIKDDTIELLVFWNNRRNPDDLNLT